MTQRVLVVGTRVHGLSAGESADTVAQAWRTATPHVEVISLASADGGPGFVDALGSSVVEQIHSVDVDGLGLPVGVSAGQSGRPAQTAYVGAADTLRVAGCDDTEVIGSLLGALIDDGFSRVVVGVGGLPCVDGGEALIAALGGGTPERRSSHDRRAGLERAVARARGTELLVVAESDRTLLGFQGAAAHAQESLRWSKEESQRVEQRMGQWVDDVRAVVPARRDLLSGAVVQDDRRPGSGAGGGLAYGLLALGAHLVPGPTWWADAIGLASRIVDAGLVVIVEEVFDWRVLEHSVLRTTADLAGAAPRPAIVVSDEVHVGRREVMSTGLAAAYGVVPTGSMRRGDRPDAAKARAELGRLAGRLATTWTPDR